MRDEFSIMTRPASHLRRSMRDCAELLGHTDHEKRRHSLRHRAEVEVLMSEHQPPAAGTIGWVDLTIQDAETLMRFYESVDRGAARCVALGGRLIVPPKQLGTMGRFCVIQDPAGARPDPARSAH